MSLVYCFMTADEEEEDMRAIIVGYDHEKSGFGALPVGREGAQEEVVKWIVDRLDEAGYAGNDRSETGHCRETQSGDNSD